MTFKGRKFITSKNHSSPALRISIGGICTVARSLLSLHLCSHFYDAPPAPHRVHAKLRDVMTKSTHESSGMLVFFRSLSSFSCLLLLAFIWSHFSVGDFIVPLEINSNSLHGRHGFVRGEKLLPNVLQHTFFFPVVAAEFRSPNSSLPSLLHRVSSSPVPTIACIYWATQSSGGAIWYF